jgi:nicotinamide-nucleotide amidase
MDFSSIAQYLGQTLKAKGLLLATAESCTGGWVAEVITSIPGSSSWFDCGFVPYSNESKQEMLEIPAQLIREAGAVSEAVARLMAENTLRNSQAQVSLAITGIAGPDGGTPEKSVGTVWFAWSGLDFETLAECAHFTGDRHAIRAQSVEFALKGLLKMLEGG